MTPPDAPRGAELFQMAPDDCCCGPPTPEAPAPPVSRVMMLGQPFVDGAHDTTRGPVPRVSAALTAADRRGAWKARWGIGRMDYAIAPGLYALGEPDAAAPVLVSANYKMSFDRLRAALPDLDAWILVLDTRGINVWCAAGKGTFGTAELLRQLELTGLAKVVEHRRLIVPQLGAPGMAAHLVRERSGFEVVYGPIEAADLPAFLAGGRRATAEMRLKRFDTAERAALIPMELVPATKKAALIAVAFALLGGLGHAEGYLSGVLDVGLIAALSVLLAVLGGAVLVPLLLPWIPGRAFSTKGVIVGLLLAAVVVAWRSSELGAWSTRFETGAWVLIIPALAGFLALNFTGASTYTSLSGVRLEMRRAIPLQAAAALIGVGLWITGRVVALGA